MDEEHALDEPSIVEIKLSEIIGHGDMNFLDVIGRKKDLLLEQGQDPMKIQIYNDLDKLMGMTVEAVNYWEWPTGPVTQ